MVVDEGWFHRRARAAALGADRSPARHADDRAVPRVAGRASPGAPARCRSTSGSRSRSTLFVTKDEAVHARLCSAGEHWLHAILFVAAPDRARGVRRPVVDRHDRAPRRPARARARVHAPTRSLYWNVVRAGSRRRDEIDNAWYADLGERWYRAEDTPIALLRAESRHRNPWIADDDRARVRARACRCSTSAAAPGFLANDLAARGHRVIGIDTHRREPRGRARPRRARRPRPTSSATRCALPFAGRAASMSCARWICSSTSRIPSA